MDVVTMLGMPEAVSRLLAAAAGGAILGLDREIRHKPAGLKTHALVSLGSALLVLATVELALDKQALQQDAVSRVIQGIAAGIGFLGGGVILRNETGQHVHGLTTAATIWLAAALGIAAGIGAWKLMMIAAVITLAVLIVGSALEHFFERKEP